VAALLQDAHRPGGGRRHPLTGPFLRRQNPDIHQWPGTRAPGLDLLDLTVHRADEVIDERIDPPARMQLIADGHFGVQRQHGKALELQRRRVLEGVKVAPGGVELARHAEAIQPGGARVALAEWEMQVSPPAAGQRFEFPVGVRRGRGAALHANVPGVVKDGAFRSAFPHELTGLRHPVVDGSQPEGAACFAIGGIEPLGQHPLPAPSA